MEVKTKFSAGENIYIFMNRSIRKYEIKQIRIIQSHLYHTQTIIDYFIQDCENGNRYEYSDGFINKNAFYTETECKNDIIRKINEL